MQLLSAEDIARHLTALPQWNTNLDGTHLTRTVTCTSFNDVIALVQRIATLAETADHHPDLLIQYNHLTITLSTHSAGGITEKDVTMAKEITALLV